MVKNKKLTHLIGIYPGTLDPVTLGHLDIIERATGVVDHLIVAVADSPHKKPLFTAATRVSMVEEAIAAEKRFKGKSIEVVSFDNLLIEFAENLNAKVLIRGLRAVSDFEYEFQMAGMNSHLSKNVETIFLMARDKHQSVSSSFIKEVARLDGDISHFVTDNVVAALKDKFR